MYGTVPIKYRLKSRTSRASFLKISQAMQQESTKGERIRRWIQLMLGRRDNNVYTIEPREQLHRGNSFPLNPTEDN